MANYGFFEPDILIAELAVTGRRRRTALSGEKRLMLAVVENALDYYQKCIFATDRVGRTLFMEAAEWIASTSNADVFSFENISETLDINPAYFRRGVAAWHKRLVEARSRAAESPAAESQEPVRASG
jgi:microcompartment protein CcmK/EutM